MRILIAHPDFNDPGGVSNFFAILDEKFTSRPAHFVIGKRIAEKTFFESLSRLIRDYIQFVKLLKKENYELVHINPSLNFKGLTRDGVFIFLAKFFKCKVLVFFHGWEKDFEKRLNGIRYRFVLRAYKKVDAFVVLSSESKKILRQWGFAQPIYVETTAVDEGMLKGLDILQIIEKRINADKHRVLFLARIIKEKGIYETIDAFRILKRKYLPCELLIAGDGIDLENAKDYVQQYDISNVIFTGYVTAETKTKAFLNSSVYCFPTYEEGMPISMLEAMAFGLPVVTRAVGGVTDFFEDGQHGFITKSMDPAVFADYIERLFLDKELYERISMHNYYYARERFLASKVAMNLEKIYRDVLEDKNIAN